MINTNLPSTSDDPCHLTEPSLICAACYIHFKARLKRIQLEKEAKCTSVTQESTVDRNADINSLPSPKMSMIYNSRESTTMSDYLDILKKLDHDDQISIKFHVGISPIQDKDW